MKKKILLFLFMLCLICTVTFVWADETVSRGGILTIARGTDSISLDPARSNDIESNKVISNIFEGLVRYKDNSLEVEPALAVSWETYDEGKTWIFHLRKGVWFHDGTPFNAEAVVFSINRQIDPAHPLFDENFTSARFTFKYVREVKALDEHMVLITLEKPYAPFLSNLAMSSCAPMVSPTAVQKLGNNDFGSQPVGAGAFRFQEWVPDDRIVLVANHAFWEGRPLLDKVVFQVIPEVDGRLKEFREGRVDVLDDVDAANFIKLKQIPEARLFSQPGLNVGYLAMNTEKKPFEQQKIRQAINHAINKRKLITLFYQDLASRANNPLPPVISGFNDLIASHPYDPGRARKLMREAGFGDGLETTLWVMDEARPYMPKPLKIAESIQSDLAAVGIKAHVVSYEWKTYLEKLKNGEHEMCLAGWNSDNGDPDNFLYPLFDRDNAVKPNSQNYAFFKNEKLHDLLIQAQQTIDKPTRLALYHQAQEIIHLQAPWVQLAHAWQLFAFHNTVHDVFFLPTGDIKFHRAWKENEKPNCSGIQASGDRMQNTGVGRQEAEFRIQRPECPIKIPLQF